MIAKIPNTELAHKKSRGDKMGDNLNIAFRTSE